jgi:hypothetical protein
LGVVVCQSSGNTSLVAFRFVLIIENASASIGHQPFRQLLRQCLFPALHEPLMQRLGNRFDRDLAPVRGWNQAWDPFLDLAPVWTEEFMAAEIMIYKSGVMPPKLIELLSIALDSLIPTCMPPAHAVTSKQRCGATIAEIIEVLKLCAGQGRADIQSRRAEFSQKNLLTVQPRKQRRPNKTGFNFVLRHVHHAFDDH